MDAQAAGAVRDPAAAALRRRAGARPPGAQVHHRPLRRRAARQHRAGLLLGQHLRPREPAALQPGGAHPARGGARSPPADRAATASSKSCPTSAASPTSRPLARAGGSTPSGSASRSASTPTPTATSAASPTRCGAPAGWWSTPACTPWAGPASRRIDYLATEHRPVAARGARPRPTATSPGPARRCPTSWASSRSSELRRARRGGAGRALRRARVPRRGAGQRLGAAAGARRVDRAVHRRAAAGGLASVVQGSSGAARRSRSRVSSAASS